MNQKTLFSGLLVGAAMLSACSNTVSDDELLQKTLSRGGFDKSELTISDRVNELGKIKFIVKKKSGQKVTSCVSKISVTGQISSMVCATYEN